MHNLTCHFGNMDPPLYIQTLSVTATISFCDCQILTCEHYWLYAHSVSGTPLVDAGPPAYLQLHTSAPSRNPHLYAAVLVQYRGCNHLCSYTITFVFDNACMKPCLYVILLVCNCTCMGLNLYMSPLEHYCTGLPLPLYAAKHACCRTFTQLLFSASAFIKDKLIHSWTC